MTERKANPFPSALAAGAAGGALSGLPYFSCLCCLWIVGAGVLAAYLLTQASPEPPVSGDGARVGALAGVAAAAVASVLSIPLAPMNTAFAKRFLERMAEYVPQMPAGWDQWLTQGGSVSFSLPWFLAGFAINAAVFAALAALGGIIGISLFVRRPPQPGPSQPGSPS